MTNLKTRLLEEFEKKFPALEVFDSIGPGTNSEDAQKAVWYWIEYALNTQREEIKEKIEGMKRESKFEPKQTLFKSIYNEAIEDVLEQLVNGPTTK
jgi:hypothetical protein